MAKRKSTGKRLRFEVLKRDKFTCQYCGAKAPDVLLRVDHIQPASKEGPTDILNLITACFDCNAGKADKVLSDESAMAKQQQQLEELQARREQLDLMVQWKTELLSLDESAVDAASEFFKKCFTGYSVSPGGRPILVQLVKKHGVSAVMDATKAAADQYLELGPDGKWTPESVEIGWSYIAKIAALAKVHEQKPYLRDLFYARACARNQCGYFKDHVALQLLEDAHLAGAALDELKRVAKRARSWSQWQAEMLEWIEDLRRKREE